MNLTNQVLFPSQNCHNLHKLIDVLGTRSARSEQNDVGSREEALGLQGGLVDGELVSGEHSGLVRAQNDDSGELFDRGDTDDNGLVLDELLGSNGGSDGKHSGHGGGDTIDQEDQNIVDAATVVVTETGVQAKNLNNDEDADNGEGEGTDLSENLLRVAGSVLVLTDERCGATEEGVGTGEDNDTLLIGGVAIKSVSTLQKNTRRQWTLTRSTGFRSSCSVGAIRH